MAGVNIKYNGTAIAELSENGTKTLKTAGTYCENDIEVEYTPNFKRWDITITSGAPSSGVELVLLTDIWLKENRANPNLCVVLLPKFTIQGDGYKFGVFLSTNMPLVNVQNVNHYSLSSYKHSNNNIQSTMRKYPLTAANDIGDLGIKSDGRLYSINYGGRDFAVGDYVVYAFIV